MSVATLTAKALVSIEEARRYVYRDENDASRDEILIDAVNDISDAIWDEYEREFLPTTVGRSGSDGVTNGTTTFVAASGAFVAGDVGALIEISTKGLFRIVTVTNGTTVVLNGSPTAGTTLTWKMAEARIFDYDGSGFLDLSPYDLRELDEIVLYTDRATTLQVTLAAANYRLHPTGRARGDTYLGILLPTPAQHEPEFGFGWQVTVTALWGMAAVPGGVKLACKEWVENIVKNPGQYASHSMSGYAVVPELDLSARRAGMPPGVRYRLERFRRSTRPGIEVVRFHHPDTVQPAVPHTLPTV